MDTFKVINKGRCRGIVNITKEPESKPKPEPKATEDNQKEKSPSKRTSSPKKKAQLTPQQMDIVNQHVIGTFGLEFDHSKEDCVEITATVQEPKLPSTEPVPPGEDKLHELYVCNTDGELVAKIPFLESDYREVLREALERSRTSEQGNQ
ncbi:uncharacterized protein [Drosophila bipectinata]|uniref:uncharacterized protein n=1 Tax=Drosophila bipectinata TaxID=42026 RepID=UPI001C895F38|nr:uncharacterized protein LOC122321066 [Drosophila bipectinata]